MDRNVDKANHYITSIHQHPTTSSFIFEASMPESGASKSARVSHQGAAMYVLVFCRKPFQLQGSANRHENAVESWKVGV